MTQSKKKNRDEDEDVAQLVGHLPSRHRAPRKPSLGVYAKILNTEEMAQSSRTPLCQRTWAGFPEATWQLTAICNSSSTGSHTLLWLPEELDTHGTQTFTQTFTQAKKNTHTHKIEISLNNKNKHSEQWCWVVSLVTRKPCILSHINSKREIYI